MKLKKWMQLKLSLLCRVLNQLLNLILESILVLGKVKRQNRMMMMQMALDPPKEMQIRVLLMRMALNPPKEMQIRVILMQMAMNPPKKIQVRVLLMQRTRQGIMYQKKMKHLQILEVLKKANNHL